MNREELRFKLNASAMVRSECLTWPQPTLYAKMPALPLERSTHRKGTA
jgi:hypothetical protein